MNLYSLIVSFAATCVHWLQFIANCPASTHHLPLSIPDSSRLQHQLPPFQVLVLPPIRHNEVFNTLLLGSPPASLQPVSSQNPLLMDRLCGESNACGWTSSHQPLCVLWDEQQHTSVHQHIHQIPTGALLPTAPHNSPHNHSPPLLYQQEITRCLLSPSQSSQGHCG